MKLAAQKHVRMLVRTVEKKLIKSARIPRNKLSRKLSEFCGDYSAYKMEKISLDDIAQFSINHQGIIQQFASNH